jgi:ankyrin repeat protein
MRILLASGKIDPNSFRSADGNAHGLLTAARSGNLEMVKVLVDAGMTFPGLGDDYNLFLDQLDAFARWDVSLIKELERAGMSIPLKQDYENRPMSSERKLMVSAARVGNLKLMEHLIEKGIDVNEDETAYGTRPIDAAVAQGRYDVVKFLVEAGASVDIYRSDNLNVSSRNLLLHSAVTSGNLEILEYLLELGADPDLRDQRPPNYLLPAELAEEQGRQEMAVLLRSKMDGRSPYELKVNKGDLPDPVRQSIQDQEQLAEDHLETMIRISQERFPLVATELNPVTGQPQPFQIMLFGEETIHVDNIYYSGFRFEVPRDLGERHLVWYQFMPTSGVMKPAPATIFRLQHPTPGELIPLFDENSFETLNFEDGLGVVQDSLGPWKFKRLNVRFDGPVAGQFQLVDNKFLKPGGIYFLCFETKRSQKPNPVQIYVNLGFAKLRGGWEKKKFRDEDWKVSERDAPTEETMISGMRFLGLDLAD